MQWERPAKFARRQADHAVATPVSHEPMPEPDITVDEQWHTADRSHQHPTYDAEWHSDEHHHEQSEWHSDKHHHEQVDEGCCWCDPWCCWCDRSCWWQSYHCTQPVRRLHSSQKLTVVPEDDAEERDEVLGEKWMNAADLDEKWMSDAECHCDDDGEPEDDENQPECPNESWWYSADPDWHEDDLDEKWLSDAECHCDDGPEPEDYDNQPEHEDMRELPDEEEADEREDDDDLDMDIGIGMGRGCSGRPARWQERMLSRQSADQWQKRNTGFLTMFRRC